MGTMTESALSVQIGDRACSVGEREVRASVVENLSVSPDSLRYVGLIPLWS
jgi:hypothetical protein